MRQSMSNSVCLALVKLNYRDKYIFITGSVTKHLAATLCIYFLTYDDVHEVEIVSIIG